MFPTPPERVSWVSAHIPLGEGLPFLPGFIELRTVHNYGAAWSSFSGQRWLLLALTSAIVLAGRVSESQASARFPAQAASAESVNSSIRHRIFPWTLYTRTRM